MFSSLAGIRAWVRDSGIDVLAFIFFLIRCHNIVSYSFFIGKRITRSHTELDSMDEDDMHFKNGNVIVVLFYIFFPPP